VVLVVEERTHLHLLSEIQEQEILHQLVPHKEIMVEKVDFYMVVEVEVEVEP
jgi:hypothetical protein